MPDGRLYLAWSGWPGDTNGVQNIYLARLANPWTITGPRTMLSTPAYPWELSSGTVPVKVNESPEPLVHGGRVFIAYSAGRAPDGWPRWLQLRLVLAHLGGASWPETAELADRPPARTR